MPSWKTRALVSWHDKPRGSGAPGSFFLLVLPFFVTTLMVASSEAYLSSPLLCFIFASELLKFEQSLSNLFVLCIFFSLTCLHCSTRSGMFILKSSLFLMKKSHPHVIPPITLSGGWPLCWCFPLSLQSNRTGQTFADLQRCWRSVVSNRVTAA